MPARKSSRRPAPARPDSFGSSAAWTAWNRNSGTRAIWSPAWNRPAWSSSAAVASSWTATVPALTSARHHQRADEERGHGARQLAPARLGAVADEAALAAHDGDDGHDRGEAEDEAVGPDGRDAGGDEHRAGRPPAARSRPR